ncbi:UNVERIFIED_ORG: FAD-binding oxidoreductase [Bacillus sp. AZ43]
MTLTLDARSVDSTIPFDALRAELTGSLHTPGEAEYDALVSPWNLAVAMRPAAVVAVRTADDVVAAVRFAGDHGLTAGVQATGHGAESSLAGHLLVVTRHLDECTVHPEGWARVGAGVKWSRLVPEAAAHGLAGVNGSTTDVGIVGYTTGGGVGPMARTFGINADRVRAFEVVTGDGVFRRVTADEHPDLFFALRGGKGAAGIVTALEFDLVHMPTFYGGAIYFAAADAPAVVARWREWADALPEQGTTSFALFQLPPLPEIPAPLAGRMSLGVRFLWTGEPGEGARLLNELRAVAPVILDDAALKPYTAIDSVHADPVDPMPVVDPAILLSDFPAEAADRLFAVAGEGSGSPQVIVEVRHIGGEYAREGRAPSAFSHRAARYSVLAVGMAPDPRSLPHAHEVFAALAPWDTGGCWPNFGVPHDAVSARRCYDGPTLARLRRIVDTYDPRGVLQAGHYLRALD